MHNSNLENWQFIRVPLCNALRHFVYDIHYNIWAFVGDHCTRWPANIASTNAANVCHSHTVYSNRQ